MRTNRSRAGACRGESGIRASLRLLLLAGAMLLVAWIAADPHQAIGQVGAAPAPQEAGAGAATESPVELAPYMDGLQRLTHKLSLSIGSRNYPLASFYLYESLESLEDIKENVPEYRGQPVALLIDRLIAPQFDKLREAIRADAADSGVADETGGARASSALTAVIDSCNQCHTATQHGFIKITDRRDFNPFNQDFKP